MNGIDRKPNSKKTLGLACVIAALLGVVASFRVYSAARTMNEHVGFDLAASALPALLTLIALCVVGAAAVVVVMTLRVRPALWRSPLLVLFVGGVAGLVGAESLILADERAFAREAVVAEASGEVQYARSRAWPNAVCSLVWNESRGIHATD